MCILLEKEEEENISSVTNKKKSIDNFVTTQVDEGSFEILRNLFVS